MKHIVMTSGGVGSFVTLSLVHERYSPQSIVSLFADTRMEDEDLYRFLEESHSALGVELTTIADGRDPWQVFKDVRFIGNSRVDPCSKILKRELIDRWIKDNYSPEECIVYIGIDWSEKHRYERLAPRKLPYVYKAPMVERQMMLSTEDKIEFCKSKGVSPPRLYELGFSHNNCGGFCVKAGLAQFKLLHEKMPDRYQYHVERERELREQNPSLRPFLKKQIKGEQHYLWLEDYREQYLLPTSEKKLTVDDEIDWGGCGCALE